MEGLAEHEGLISSEEELSDESAGQADIYVDRGGIVQTAQAEATAMNTQKLILGIELHFADTGDGVVFGVTRHGDGYALAVSWSFHFQLAKIVNDAST